jgi:ribosomal protein L29
MKKYLIYMLITLTGAWQLRAQAPIVTTGVTIKDAYDNVLTSRQGDFVHQLIGTYAGWDPEAIFVGGYNASSVYNATSTKRIYLGGPLSGTYFLGMDIPTGNLGLNVMNPQSYFHGGNNKVFEILNPNTEINSQSHLILSNNSTLSGSSAGSITWVAKNAQFNKGMAYIGAQLTDDATNDARARLFFATSNGAQPVVRMVIDPVGNIGIGTYNPEDKLTVNGRIKANEIQVNGQEAPDYVFHENYKNLPLPELEAYIKKHKHLPEVPSAEEAEKNGIELGEMNKLLQKNIEELNLHLIELYKEIMDMKMKQLNGAKQLKPAVKSIKNQTRN